jgi:AcrR family transcriptional regulator
MPRDATATKARIMEAAVAEFAEYGVGGARMERIAARARANKRSLYDHFGDKAELFAIVLADQLERLAAAVELRSDGIAQYVGELYDYCAAHPELVRLVQWEALSLPPREAPRYVQRSASYQRKVDAIATAQRDGLIDASLDPRRVLLLLIGMAEWTLYVPQLAGMILQQESETHAQQRAFLVAVVERLLAP